MAAYTGARTGLSPPALSSDSGASDHSATEGTMAVRAALQPIVEDARTAYKRLKPQYRVRPEATSNERHQEE